MKLPQRLLCACHQVALLIASLLFLNMGLTWTALANAQTLPSPLAPAEGSSCVISAQNRNAPVVLPDYSHSIFGLLGASGAFRARLTCPDGSIGLVPTALGLTAQRKRLATNDVSQFIATAANNDAGTRDVTARANGTTYAISNSIGISSLQ